MPSICCGVAVILSYMPVIASSLQLICDHGFFTLAAVGALKPLLVAVETNPKDPQAR
jgi:hypothetical protein